MMEVGPFKYTRRNYEPREGHAPVHDWIREHTGHKAIVGQETNILLDEIERLRSELDASDHAHLEDPE